MLYLWTRTTSSSRLSPHMLSALSLLLALSACSSEPSGSEDIDQGAADMTVADMARETDAGADMSGSPREEMGAVDAPDASLDMAPTTGDEEMGSTPLDMSPDMPDLSSMRCAPLPAPEGNVVRVTPAQADDLPSIVAQAASGTTILLADGVYKSSRSGEAARRIQFKTPGVTLRSESGDPGSVILDGEYGTKELINIQASDVTIAEISIRRAEDHLIHATGNGAQNISGTTLYRLVLEDAGEQFVKVNPSGDNGYVDEGSLTCSTLELTDAGRPNIERASGGCYTGGIDAHAARDWVVNDNLFQGIYCAGEGLAEHAIHFWRNSRGTIVRRNVIRDCARGIGFGLNPALERRVYADNPYPDAGLIEHIDGLVQNNFIFNQIAFYDTGIELQHVRGARIEHNTVMSTQSATGFYTSLDYRFPVTQVTIRNNIVRRLTRRNEASATLEANLEAPPASIFVDLASGDLHLAAAASQAIDKGVVIEDLTRDIDGDAREDGKPDIGADELD